MVNSKYVSISKYTVYHTAYCNVPNWSQEPPIFIQCADAAGAFIGRISFYPKDKLPQSSVASEGNIFLLNYEIDRFPDVISTLRYEKPVYAAYSWNDQNLMQNGKIGSGQEPVGEQEGV